MLTGQGKRLMIGVVCCCALLVLAILLLVGLAVEQRSPALLRDARNALATWRSGSMPPADPPVARTKAGPHPPLPIGNPGGWFETDDYPAEAYRKGLQGRTAVALDVDRRGRPSACRVTASSGSQVLDEATCGLFMRRAHFTPAADAKNVAVPGVWTTAVRWTLDDESLFR